MRFIKFLLCLLPFLSASCVFSQAEQGAVSNIRKPVIYQIAQTVHINASGPRPLLQAIDALQGKYGWAVNYEDPQYPPPVANTPSPPNRRRANISGNVAQGFSVQFNAGPTPDSRPDESTVLDLIVDANNQSNDKGQFELRQGTEGSFDVVGVGVRDLGGETSSQQPILDASISLAAERRTGSKTISLICQEVSQQSKIPITAIELEIKLLRLSPIVVSGNGVAARTLLTRVLASTGNKLYWRLIYDSSRKSYQLTIDDLVQ